MIPCYFLGFFFAVHEQNSLEDGVPRTVRGAYASH